MRLLRVVVLLIGVVTAPRFAAANETVGSNIDVGLYRISVQFGTNALKVDRLTNAKSNVLPALTARVLSWDTTQVVRLEVSIRNGGTKSLFSPRAVLKRMLPQRVIAVNPDAGTGPGSWSWTYAGIFGANASTQGREWVLRGQARTDLQMEVLVVAGVPLAPGEGATLTGPSGTSVTVAPDSIPYEVLVDIEPVELDDIAAPLGPLSVVGAVNITFVASESGAALPVPSAPLTVSIPGSLSPPSANYVVAQQMVADAFDGTQAELRDRLVPVSVASLSGDTIESAPGPFDGILSGGLLVFVAHTGSGFVTGAVFDTSGPRAGVVVSNNTNTLVAVTNGAGQYTTYISGSLFTVTGFDPFRGSWGASGGTVNPLFTLVVPIILIPQIPTPLLLSRDGIRNGGFERGDLSSWASTGAVRVVTSFGPTSTGASIAAPEGEQMVDISTGPGAIGGVGSSLRQRFRVPAGVSTLRFDFNFISEEFPEFVGSIFDDSFRAIVTTPDGDATIAHVSVNHNGGFQLIGDCFFPGGDNTCGMTGWRQGSVDLSLWAGTGQTINVELVFSANDAGDNIYDTHVLVDNLRFSTVWIDAKALPETQADTDSTRVRHEVRGANEILSQAGINVRLRNARAVSDPGGLADMDRNSSYDCDTGGTNCGFTRTTEEESLLALERGSASTDVNVYYVRSIDPDACAIAIGPDDFRAGPGARLLVSVGGGTIHRNTGGGCAPGGHVLAHELGHLLISPQTAGDILEHRAGLGNFMGGDGSAPLLGTVSRVQSTNMNRMNAPLLVP